MARNYSNIAFDTTLVAGIGAGDLSLVVASATGWPAVPFAAVLDPGLVTEEVVQVTNKAGTTFTITRGFDGTTAAAHALGATVRHSAIAGDFTDLQAADTAEGLTRAADDSTLAGLISAEAGTRAAADALLTPMARTLTINGVTLDLSANRSWTISAGSGTVTSVDLTVPGVLFSVSGNPVTTSGTLALSLLTQTANTVLAGPTSGGAATPTMRSLVAADIPAISLTAGVSGILPPANGGTGTNNTGNLAWPASGGTAALLGTANVFTQAQTINGANLGIAITGAASGGTPSIVASSPAQVASATAGTPLQITASPAVAGSSNAGAAVGGNVTITAGAAARLTSGNATGGNIVLTPGAGIGTGLAGAVILPQSASTAQGNGGIAFGANATDGSAINIQATNNTVYFYGQNLQIGKLTYATGFTQLSTQGGYGWSNATSNDAAKDTNLYRNAAGVVEVNNGTAGQWGALKAGTRDAGTTTITDGLTLGHQSTGTPAAGLGIGIALNLNSSTTADQSAARVDTLWTDATHATRTSALTFSTVSSAGAMTERLRVDLSGLTNIAGVSGTRLGSAQLQFAFNGGSALIVNNSSNANTGLNLQASAGISTGQSVAVLFGAVETARFDVASAAASSGAVVDNLILRRNPTSGTPATGTGQQIRFVGKSDTTTNQDMASVATLWTDATHATRKARTILSVYDTAAREWVRGEADGTNPMIGFLGANATARVAITGSRGANAALASLLTELAAKGLITDSTTV